MLTPHHTSLLLPVIQGGPGMQLLRITCAWHAVYRKFQVVGKLYAAKALAKLCRLPSNHTACTLQLHKSEYVAGGPDLMALCLQLVVH